MNSQNNLRSQWTQLLALSFAHFAVDCFGGLMHTVLPAIQQRFIISVQAGAVLLTAFLISANGIQIAVGHLRSEKQSPLFLYIGMLSAMSVLLFSFVPEGSAAMPVAVVVAVACGAGIGMTHPESLRAVHRIEGIHSTLSSSIFMAGGIAGFAAGGWASTYLFEQWGFWGQLPFCILTVLAIFTVRITNVRLAVEEPPSRRKFSERDINIPFWPIMVIATLSAIASQVMCWLIPQHLSIIGAKLSAGGAAVAIFILAGGIGGIVMSRPAGRRGEAFMAAMMLLAGVPFIAAYLWLMRFDGSLWIMFAGGFLCYGAYPILVSLARHSRGPRLGQRMGLIVGGIWLIACIVPMLLGRVVEKIGTQPVLIAVPIIFAASGTLAAWLALKIRQQKIQHQCLAAATPIELVTEPLTENIDK